MPKVRKKPGTRKIEKRIFIICEGKKDKSESAYFKSFIAQCKFSGDRIEVKVIDTKKNTGKELVKEAIKIKEFSHDSAWVVYDKNGYTKHKETFANAADKNIKIGFSSIAFEYWILLHFKYTTKQFTKSEELIKYLQHHFFKHYSKCSSEVYDYIKIKLPQAKLNAKKVRKEQKKAHYSNTPIYELNPYTNLDELIEEIESLQN